MALDPALRERLTLPVIVAPMFMVSGPELAVAACRAGLIGTLTRNHCRSDEDFAQQLASVQAGLAHLREAGHAVGPLAANVMVNFPADTVSAALAACAAHGVDILITAGGDPTETAARVHDSGARIFHDVTSVRFAEKAIRGGVDGIIAIGAGGGGHSGTISHLALIPQLRQLFDGTIVMAGAVASGAAVRAAEVLGADLAYMGTRFIATQESMAPDAYKQLLVSQSPDELIYSPFANGMPAMWLKQSMRDNGLDPENPPMPAGKRNSSHLPAHVKPWINLWSAGQGIGLVHDIPPVAELAERLRCEYLAACAVPTMADAAAKGLAR